MKKDILIILAIFLFSFGFRLWNITKHFEVWDETAVVRVGEIYINSIKSLDFSENTWKLNKEHPPFSKYFYGASRIVTLNSDYLSNNIDQDFPLGRRYSLQRILSAFVGSITIVLLYILASKFYNSKIALISSLILSLTPHYFAHSRVATQENFVSFMTLVTVCFFFFALRTRKLKHRFYIISGVLLGLSIATKYNSLFFLVLFLLLTLSEFGRRFLKSRFLILKNDLILIPFLALGTFYAVWPWLWPDPVGRFLSSVSRINGSRYFEYFLGQFPSPHSWYYFFVYLFATTPPIILLGVFLFGIKFIFKRGKYDFWFLMYFLTPLMATFSPLKMDGIRYIFPIYPAMAIISGVGFYFLIDISGKFIDSTYKSIVEFATPVIVFGILFMTILIYHPFYFDYYNIFFGGPSGVYKNRLFDFGYWGEGLRDGMNFIYKEDPDIRKKVYLKILPVHVLPPYKNNTVYVDEIEKADYVIINPAGEWLNQTNYLDYDFPYNFDIVFEEALMDAPIVQVYKRKFPYIGKL